MAVPGNGADGENRGAGWKGVVLPGRGRTLGRGARRRGGALYHPMRQPLIQCRYESLFARRIGLGRGCGSSRELWAEMGRPGVVPKLSCWQHCEPRRRPSARYAVLIEPTWLCEAGPERGGGKVNGSSTVVMIEGLLPDREETESCKAWHVQVSESTAAVIGRLPHPPKCMMSPPCSVCDVEGSRVDVHLGGITISSMVVSWVLAHIVSPLITCTIGRLSTCTVDE